MWNVGWNGLSDEETWKRHMTPESQVDIHCVSIGSPSPIHSSLCDTSGQQGKCHCEWVSIWGQQIGQKMDKWIPAMRSWELAFGQIIPRIDDQVTRDYAHFASSRNVQHRAQYSDQCSLGDLSSPHETHAEVIRWEQVWSTVQPRHSTATQTTARGRPLQVGLGRNLDMSNAA